MSSSFINKDDQSEYGFWVRDAHMQVVCWGLLQAIDETPLNENNPWLKGEFRELIFNNSQGIFVGWMHLRLNDFLVDEKRTNAFNEIINKAKSMFSAKGDYLLPEELNAFQLVPYTKRSWTKPLKTNYIITILNLFFDVANDRLKATLQINEYG